MVCGCYVEESLINGINFNIRRELAVDHGKFLTGVGIFLIVSNNKNNMGTEFSGFIYIFIPVFTLFKAMQMDGGSEFCAEAVEDCQKLGIRFFSFSFICPERIHRFDT